MIYKKCQELGLASSINIFTVMHEAEKGFKRR